MLRARGWPPPWEFDNGAYLPTHRDERPAEVDRLLCMGLTMTIDQGTWWKTGEGEWLWLPEMSRRYKANVRAFLLRRAPRLEFSWALRHFAGDEHTGDMASVGLEQAMHEHDDWVRRVGYEQWLRERPLLRELTYQIESAAYDGPRD
jgi:hypothetical protein